MYLILISATDFFWILDDLERFSRPTKGPAAVNAVRECRAALGKLVVSMDGLEAGFDHIVKRSRRYGIDI